MCRKFVNLLIQATEIFWPNANRPIGYQASRRSGTSTKEIPAIEIIQRVRYERERNRLLTADTVVSTVVAVGVAAIPLVYSITTAFTAGTPLAWPTA